MSISETYTEGGPSHISVESLRRIVTSVEPRALLVDPWIMRRVIRMDRRLTGLGFHVPHLHAYTIERERLLAYVDRPELELSPSTELPSVVILLCKPSEEELIERGTAAELLHRYSRLLFHARIHLDLEYRYPEREPPASLPEERQQEIGELEFDEIQQVLLQEDLLFTDPTIWETYVEFVAVYLELRYYEPEDLPAYFPAIRDWNRISEIVTQDVSHNELYETSRLARLLPAEAGIARNAELSADGAVSVVYVDGNELSPTKVRKWQQRALRSAKIGNRVLSALYWQRAAFHAPPGQQTQHVQAAMAQLTQLVYRLRDLLRLDDGEQKAWIDAFEPLLPIAARSLWSAEARLLFDLQKVCIEYESSPQRVDWLRWIQSGFREPWKRSLPMLREVLLSKHIRSAEKRLAKSQLGKSLREEISQLLGTAVEHLEEGLRAAVRPQLNQLLDNVGIVAHNLPESVARQKLIEELLDHVTEHGYLNTGIFRDALSKGDIKLPDVSGPWELWNGDLLLQADRELAHVLDGVYRPAAIYIRWSQRLSALAFGTPLGRFFTLYVALPFGGAFLAIEGIRHVVHWVSGGHSAGIPEAYSDVLQGSPTPAPVTESPAHGTPWAYYVSLATLGTFIFLLMHHRGFRNWCKQALQNIGRVGRQALVDLPMALLHFPLLQQILHSPAYATFRSYLLKPAILTGLAYCVIYQLSTPWSWRGAFELYLVLALFLNSPVGRYADEWLTDVLIRFWEELRVRVIAAFFQRIMDIFHQLLTGLDRVLFALDEWSRFRARDNRVIKVIKLISGSLWSVVSYFIVFVSTLLIEPQINPIKHFPVVTVAHKLILPLGPFFVNRLDDYIGAPKAHTLVWSTIWLIPGVFGFLVWELKENWRLYQANRPQLLQPQPIGHHGETMIGLLRKSFHSGTLPKLYQRLRRAIHKARRAGDWKPANRQMAALRGVERSVKQFVDRELLGPLRQLAPQQASQLQVSDVRTATNRLDVALRWAPAPELELWISWEEHQGQLAGKVTHNGLTQALPPGLATALALSMTGLFQRTGVDSVEGQVGTRAVPSLTWQHWVNAWSRSATMLASPSAEKLATTQPPTQPSVQPS